MKQYTILFFLCVCPFVICGQVLNREMSLKDCMEYALAHSAKMDVQDAENADARIARRDAILKAFTPSVSGGTYASMNFGRSVDPETNTYISTSSFNNGYSVAGSITLFNGFSAVNNIRIAKTAVKMGLTQEQQLRDEICLAVMEAYCNVIYFFEMMEVLQGQVETAKENLLLAQRQEELGQKSYADVVQLEADLADREYQLITMTNRYNEAMMMLKDLMMWEDDNNAQCTMHNAQFLEMDILESCAFGENSEKECDALVETHPAVILAEYRMGNARLDLNNARWRFAPSLSLSGGWSTGYFTYPGMKDYVAMPFGSQFANNSGEYVQLSLSIPIYDGLSRYSNIARKKNAYRRAEAEYRQTLHEVATEIERAKQDREGALVALRQAERREYVQKEAYNINVKKFEQGLISPIELKSSGDNYLNAQAEYLNAQLQYYIKNSVVNYYNGVSYINQLK